MTPRRCVRKMCFNLGIGQACTCAVVERKLRFLCEFGEQGGNLELADRRANVDRR
ncbi:hypothetical protein BDZ91DRAFT_730088 [Kalaharituber pfeilii]|nr:hypothetical protein BDZ91DRAFT_730088 [Kalaharituber pfeilii]